MDALHGYMFTFHTYSNYIMGWKYVVHVHGELWMVELHKIPHSNQNTQASIKFYHGAIKCGFSFETKGLRGVPHRLTNHDYCRNPTLGLSVRRQLTLPKMGKWRPPGLPKNQKTIWGVKSSCLRAFFISMESYWSIDVQNGLALPIRTSAAQVMGKRRAGSQTANLTPDH